MGEGSINRGFEKIGRKVNLDRRDVRTKAPLKRWAHERSSKRGKKPSKAEREAQKIIRSGIVTIDEVL